MKKYIYIVHLALLTATCCLAQKQITKFVNSEDKQAFNPVYQSQIGNRMIFSSFTPATGNELWVSDGTKANTKLLKEIVPGYENSYSSDFTKAGDFLYFVANGHEIWKTDGSSSGTQKLFRSDSTLNLNIVSGKLLVAFRNNNTQRFAFAWLDTNGQTDFLNEDATTFRYSGGNLYYGVHDSTAKKWTLKVFDSEVRTLASHVGLPLNEIIVEKQNGYEYIAVDAGNTEKKLVVAAINRAENPKTYDWNRGPAPLMLRDKAGALFLINDGGFFNNNVTLKIFKVIAGQNWETVADIVTSKLYEGTPTGSSEGPFHTDFVIEGDQLTFTTLFGYESIYSAYLGVFDFKKNTKRISPSLPREITGRGIKIIPQSRDVFELRYSYAKCTYDVAQNKPISVEQLPYRVQKVKVADKEYELSDNVYITGTTLRLPLISRRPIYAAKGLDYRTIFNNKLLFWTNNDEQGSGKLWISDGKTTSELLSYDGLVVSWKMATDSMRVGNQIVFTSTSPQGLRIFKTDGTKAGTREIYLYPTEGWPSVDKVITNNRMVVFDLIAADKKVSLVSDLEKVWEIDNARFGQREFRTTGNDIYMIHYSIQNGISHDMVYKFQDGELKLIELNKGGEDAVNHIIYDNRIVYMLRNSSGQLHDVCYTDAGSDKVNRLYTGPMTYLFRNGDCLIAGTMSGPDVKIYKASTAELLGEFTNVQPIDPFTGSTAILRSARQVVIVHNDAVISREVTGDVEYMVVIPQGILIKAKGNTGNSIYIYDLKRGKISELFKDQPVEFAMAGTGDRLLFGEIGNNPHQILWDLAKEKRVDFPVGFVVTRILDGDLALAYDQSGTTTPTTVYSVEGNTPVKKYEVPGWYDFGGGSDPNYTPFYTATTGFELARFDRDSLFHYPEIVRGAEGITLQEVFRYRGSVFAVAFTYSKGLQVWKMDEMSLTPDNGDELVVIRPEMPGRGGNLPDDVLLNAYPNPVVHELNIDLKEGGVIRILDPKGYEQLKTAVGKSKRLDVSKLPAGEYMLIYSGMNGRVVKKIVKL
ncbi:hypothetical protein GCM10007423_09490 [Dyadobacter endophyticus]|uniref:Secretion system C-terminal sorting domain-containing protein n=1 Tax=Dyadobacter endophyticus TaxID=1749036 RepID=A0ABQ1YGP9_9BACT|nr:T9SS type A sorting domain-containing protein [Dyadobacter endophyticus]GGH25350.1 hypothetical protein GCM10007423_09490 [Dyadobacter endophyticus]